MRIEILYSSLIGAALGSASLNEGSLVLESSKGGCKISFPHSSMSQETLNADRAVTERYATCLTAAGVQDDELVRIDHSNLSDKIFR